MSCYLVRFGAFAHVAPFATESVEVYRRGTQVICRTTRGLEIAEVLTEVESTNPEQEEQPQIAGQILRRVSQQDRLLLKRLEQHRVEAIKQCAEKLESLNSNVALMDAELLFDGKSLFFYFLGDHEAGLDALTDELAETYESKVQFRKFTDAVNTGCGPLCGTEQAEGCSTSGGCQSCALAGGCSAN